MRQVLSAIADGVNIPDKGRALFPRLSDIAAMDGTWRDRLREALTASGKSKREVSLAADCGPGYLHDILDVGKEPSIDRLMRITDALGVSLAWLLLGIQIEKDEEELLRLYAKLSPKQRQAIRDLASPVPQ